MCQAWLERGKISKFPLADWHGECSDSTIGEAGPAGRGSIRRTIDAFPLQIKKDIPLERKASFS